MNLQTVYTDCRQKVHPSPSGVRSSGCCRGFRSGVGLAVRRFLCAGKYIAPLTEYERGGPHGGFTFPGILLMTWRAQGVMNGWLLVFLFKRCCHKAS